MIVTSPPYFGLRKYVGGTEDDFGREKTVEEYVEHTILAMRECSRVLRDDGILFWNVGDRYYGSGRGAGRNDTNDTKMNPVRSGAQLGRFGKAKSLCLIPQRVALAAAADGWIVRSWIDWVKPNCIPDSVRDRCTCCSEVILMLTKQGKYYYNTEEAVEPSICWEKGSFGGGVTPSQKDGKMKFMTMKHTNKLGSSKTANRFRNVVGGGPKEDRLITEGIHGKRSLMPPIGNAKHQALGKGTLVGHRMEMKPTRNLRNVWIINTQPHKESHIAMFPEAVPALCIRIGSRPGDVVLDPFAGSGTTGLVARQMGRNSVLLDISEEYVNLMKQRLKGNK
jgi:hypothetical protein